MKKLLSLLALGMTLSFGAAHAQENGATLQQGKMATCNKDADGKKGDARKTFMKECLSNKPQTQQSKMKTCNEAADGKKGDERKTFMRACLKNKA